MLMSLRKTALFFIVFALTLCIVVFAACTPENDSEPDDEIDDILDQEELPDDDSNESGWPGNADIYSVAAMPALENSPLKNLTIYWLGSSVTYGAEGEGVSDFIAKRHGCSCIKEAVPGTTLRTSDNRADSYVERLTAGASQTDVRPDLFVCQLSTNDAQNRLSLLGQPTADDIRDRSEFDISTTCGAIEYIISYVSDTWGCRIAFWSNPNYSSVYGKLVDRMRIIAEKWDIMFWNMYDDVPLPEDGSSEAQLYMTDRIHPSKAGYGQWWMPYFERKITEGLGISGS